MGEPTSGNKHSGQLRIKQLLPPYLDEFKSVRMNNRTEQKLSHFLQCKQGLFLENSWGRNLNTKSRHFKKCIHFLFLQFLDDLIENGE